MLLSSRDLRLLLSHTPSPPSCLQATAPASQSRSPVLQRRRIRRAAAVRVLDERLESEAAPSKRQLPTQRIPRPSSPTAQHQYPAHSAELQEQPSHQQQPNLFDLEHLPEFSPSFAAWCPIGVAVAMGRMLLWIACIALDLPVFKNKRVVSEDSSIGIQEFPLLQGGTPPILAHASMRSHSAPVLLCGHR